MKKQKTTKKLDLGKLLTVLLAILAVLLVTGLYRGFDLYMRTLNSKLKTLNILQLALFSQRNILEAKHQKDLAYSECVVQISFTDMWFPWTMQQKIDQLNRKIEYCETLIDAQAPTSKK